METNASLPGIVFIERIQSACAIVNVFIRSPIEDQSFRELSREPVMMKSGNCTMAVTWIDRLRGCSSKQLSQYRDEAKALFWARWNRLEVQTSDGKCAWNCPSRRQQRLLLIRKRCALRGRLSLKVTHIEGPCRNSWRSTSPKKTITIGDFWS